LPGLGFLRKYRYNKGIKGDNNMYCSKCGYEIQDGAVFCAKCGANVESQRQNHWDQGQNVGDQTLVIAKPSMPSLETAAAESKSVASLIMGIIGCAASFLLAGLVLGPLAISNGKQARSVLDSSNYNFNIAQAGVITGSIGLGLSIFFAIYWTIIGFGLFGYFHILRNILFNHRNWVVQVLPFL